MKIIFFGTSKFAENILKKINNISLVVTRPDMPQGRKKILTPPLVKVLAEQKSIPLLQPVKLDDNFNQKISALKPDIFVIAEYGNILPKSLLAIPQHGALNIHPSLLPKYRGPSPVQTALLNNETETGVTIIKLDEKMDHGPILNRQKIIINKQDNYTSLSKKLAQTGAELLIKTIPDYVSGKIKPQPQDHTKATFTKIIKKQDGLITEKKTAQEIHNLWRAYIEWPGIFLSNGTKLLNLELITDKKNNNLLKINRLQPTGKKAMDAQSYINGYLKNNQNSLFISSLF